MMIETDYIQNKVLYDNNEEMKNFVDKYAKKEDISVEKALTHVMVSNYREYLQNSK